MNNTVYEAGTVSNKFTSQESRMEREYDPAELIPIVAELAEKYTGCDHTSITYEKAQSLMDAVLYCLNESASSDCCEVSRNAVSVRKLYDLGYRLLVGKVKELREMYQRLSLEFRDYGLVCLQETVMRGMPEFLKRYDTRFCPQETLLTLEYPVLEDHNCRRELSGADFVYEYLQCICLEQKFLQRFSEGYVREVLRGYHSHYEILFENVCSILLQNVIGHLLLNKPLQERGFTLGEYEQLWMIFDTRQEKEIEDFIEYAIHSLTEKFYPGDEGLYQYLRRDSENIAGRIRNAVDFRCLEKLFIL